MLLCSFIHWSGTFHGHRLEDNLFESQFFSSTMDVIQKEFSSSGLMAIEPSCIPGMKYFQMILQRKCNTHIAGSWSSSNILWTETERFKEKKTEFHINCLKIQWILSKMYNTGHLTFSAWKRDGSVVLNDCSLEGWEFES